MAVNVAGFDFFLQQIKPELRGTTEFYFTELYQHYQRALEHLPAHLIEIARQFQDEREKSLFINALDQVQQNQKQMLNTFAFHMLEALQIITGESTGQMSAVQVKSTYDNFALQAQPDEIQLKQYGDNYLQEQQQNLQVLQQALENFLAVPIGNITNPFNPIYIFNAVHFSLRIKSVHSRAKLEVLTIFNEYLFSALKSIYSQVLKQFKQQGLLQKSVQTQGQEQPEQLIDIECNELLINGVVPPTFSNKPYLSIRHNADAQLTPKALDQLLKQIQKGYDPHTDGLLIQHIKHVLQQDKSPEGLTAPDQQAENLINLVSLLFSHLAENTDSKIGDLLLRLTVPFCRIILSDELFFHDSKHPARTLLARLIQLIHSNLDHGLLFKQVQFYTAKLSLAEPSQALLQELTETIETHLSQQATPEFSLEKIAQQQKTEEQQRFLNLAVESLISTKTQTLSRKLNFHYLLEFFLQDIFIDIYQRFGQDSIEWQNAKQFLQLLIAALDSQRDKKAFLTANKLLNTTVKTFNRYLTELQIDPNWRRYFFEQMQEIQQRLLRGETLNDIDEGTLKHSRAIDTIIDHYESEKTAKLLETCIIGAENKTIVRPFTNEISNTDAQQIVQQLQQGQWINMMLDGRRTPCFMSYHAQQRNTYLFSNASYQKLFERDEQALIADFQAGYAALLNRHTQLAESILYVFRFIKQYQQLTTHL